MVLLFNHCYLVDCRLSLSYCRKNQILWGCKCKGIVLHFQPSDISYSLSKCKLIFISKSSPTQTSTDLAKCLGSYNLVFEVSAVIGWRHFYHCVFDVVSLEKGSFCIRINMLVGDLYDLISSLKRLESYCSASYGVISIGPDEDATKLQLTKHDDIMRYTGDTRWYAVRKIV